MKRIAITLLATMALIGGISAKTAAPPSYAGSVTDFDNYLLAIAADLKTAYKAEGQTPPKQINDIVDDGYRLWNKRVVWTQDGGWLMEPGALRDHPDYAYALQTDLGASAKAPDAQQAWDTSHSTRFPLFLVSLMQATTGNEHNFFAKMQSGLDFQFEHHVLVQPTPDFRLYRLNNYMDGKNGVYRKGYGRPDYPGEAPYQLTGTLMYGWWAFLNVPNTDKIYTFLANHLPLQPGENGPNGPYKIIADKDNDMWWLICRLASIMNHPEDASQIGSREQAVWDASIKPMWQHESWGHGLPQIDTYRLMVPMHAAFWLGQNGWQKDCADQFARFSQTDPGGTWHIGMLDKLHYLYFASRYAVLCLTTGHQDLLPPNLLTIIKDQISDYWFGASGNTVSQVGWGEPKFTAYKDYMAWKLSR